MPPSARTIIRRIGRTPRLRTASAIRHKPSGHGKGKWHDLASLWRYKRKARRLRKVATASRLRNAG